MCEIVKIIQSLRFLVGASSEPRLSSMDFTFARFALNMAMASSRTEPEMMLKAGAPAFLVGMLTNPNELVSFRTSRRRPPGQWAIAVLPTAITHTHKPSSSVKRRGRLGTFVFVSDSWEVLLPCATQRMPPSQRVECDHKGNVGGVGGSGCVANSERGAP